jgi:hypothetical protein
MNKLPKAAVMIAAASGTNGSLLQAMMSKPGVEQCDIKLLGAFWAVTRPIARRFSET